MIAICDCLRPHFSGCCFSSEKSQSGHLDRYHNPISFSRRVRLSLAPRKFDGVESKDEDWKLACRPLSSLVSHFSQTKLMQYYHRPPSSSSGKSFQIPCSMSHSSVPIQETTSRTTLVEVCFSMETASACGMFSRLWPSTARRRSPHLFGKKGSI